MIDTAAIATALASLPKVLRALLAPFDDDALLARPGPGEWCVHEVVGHLIVCDGSAFRGRIEALMAGSRRVPAFDASAAMRARAFVDDSIGDLLDEFQTVRAESAEFVRTLKPEDCAHTGEYPEHGTFAAGDFVLEWPYHDQEHVAQILAALQLQYLPHMSETMRTALLRQGA